MIHGIILLDRPVIAPINHSLHLGTRLPNTLHHLLPNLFITHVHYSTAQCFINMAAFSSALIHHTIEGVYRRGIGNGFTTQVYYHTLARRLNQCRFILIDLRTMYFIPE